VGEKKILDADFLPAHPDETLLPGRSLPSTGRVGCGVGFIEI
jgi:hypothetical protein